MRSAAIAIAALALFTACHSTTGPSSTSSQATSLSGTWVGDLIVLGQTARMTWTLTQSNTSVSGPVLVSLSNGVVLLNGSLNGTLADPTLTYTITIGPGGIPAQPSCTGQLGGTMTVMVGAVSTLTGTFSVASSTCPSPFPGGTFTLTKQ